TVTLTEDLAELLDDEARRRRTSVSAVVRQLLTEGLVGSAERPREIPWAGIVDDPGGAPARDLDEVLAREWADDIHRDRR
ncbi:MAG TPA: ribbon-helix-helix protein, CopG family, partial [Thermoanaerobaculia bacterium]|nr:ribbon-helix-helix protein, CopG family [Thermoanaerobaculia bacterium]